MPRRRRPPPTAKLTLQLQAELCAWLYHGNYLETAASLVGLAPDTVRKWLRRGIREGSGRYHTFALAVQKSEAEAAARSLNRIRAAGERGVWKADAWFLERKFPQQWGRWERVTVEDIGGQQDARNIMRDKRVRDLLDRAAAELELARDPSGDGD